jgi:2-polyprenyl-3-methyl-5-hydroxy-6-metoxy-1,4-benzoquinol methylase
MENPLYARLRDQYQVGDHYIAAYLTHKFGSADIGVERFDQMLASGFNQANWTNYGLSTNIRGRTFLQLLRAHLPREAHRYLDVGSAQGGFLIAFLELGFEVKGIEYDEKLVRLSRANLKDHGREDVVLQGDILDEEFLAPLGKFDVITCIDVIEHVEDASLAMKNMAGLLNPGGILVLQMPNKDSISNVIADSHFNLFGIALLKHSDARQFYFCNFPSMSAYNIGEFYSQEDYLKFLTELGCQPLVLPPGVPTSLTEKARLIPKYFSRLREFIFKNKASVPFDLKLKVVLRATLNISEFMMGLGIARLFPGQRKAALKRKFADDAWFIIGTKLYPK